MSLWPCIHWYPSCLMVPRSPGSATMDSRCVPAEFPLIEPASSHRSLLSHSESKIKFSFSLRDITVKLLNIQAWSQTANFRSYLGRLPALWTGNSNSVLISGSIVIQENWPPVGIGRFSEYMCIYSSQHLFKKLLSRSCCCDDPLIFLVNLDLFSQFPNIPTSVLAFKFLY